MSTTKFLTKTVTKTDLKALSNIGGDMKSWIESKGASWVAARRQWGNVVEDADCPLSASAAAQKITACLG